MITIVVTNTAELLLKQPALLYRMVTTIYEQIGPVFVGERIYILKKPMLQTRALHLNTNRV
jgi:hypothetical protein